MKRTAAFFSFLFLYTLTGFRHQPQQGGGDGPYVLYGSGKTYLHYFRDGQLQSDSFPTPSKEPLHFNVETGVPGETFSVLLKGSLKNEKPNWKAPARMLILSDIEGNFPAFRKLLQSNGVIDSAFNWTFGDGHLVLSGDFVDRGDQVLQVLWLIYALEDKARDAGGYVHYVLGNHEIMNLSGDTRYVHPKYMMQADSLHLAYMTLFGTNSELGRWLRTKNIMERIGNMIFIHGGISQPVNTADLNINSVNELARPFYPDTTYNYPDPRIDLLFGDMGPFWYRGYYMGNKATQNQVDSTLDNFSVKYIFTGHTIIADTISRSYNGHVFDTDVHHAKGFSEAILKEGDRFYRVNAKGERFPL